MAGSTPRFSPTAADYARFRAGFPPTFLDRLERQLGSFAGRAVVDVGTGTGTLARQLTARGADVIGVDVSESQLAMARALAEADAELDGREATARWSVGAAEDTGLPAASADLVIAGQCWHWFDRPRAAAEARRLLRPGGQLVIAHFDFLSHPHLPEQLDVVRVTMEVVDRHRGSRPPEASERLGLRGMYPSWLDDCLAAGFREVESWSFESSATYAREAWRGRMRASAWIGGRLDEAQVAAFDRDLEEQLERAGVGPTFEVPHRVFAVVAVAPSR